LTTYPEEKAMIRDKALLVYTNYSTFVKADEEILSSKYEVTCYHFRPGKGALPVFKELVRQWMFLLSHIKSYDLIFIWFADTHAFLPVLFSRCRKTKSALVIGGYDAVALPELRYGLYCSNRMRRFFGGTAIRYANFILPVDSSLTENVNYYADKTGNGIMQGFKHFVKRIKGQIIPLPTGYDPVFWNYNPAGARRNSVITVVSVNNWQRWYLKGCDFLLSVSREMPETEFHIYGIAVNMMQKISNLEIPDNFFLHGFVSRDELRDIYGSNNVYAQFSLSEGLPNALCEAMMCGCVPVGSDVNGIPYAIGDERLIIRKKVVAGAVKVIRYAGEVAGEQPDRFRKRIIDLFPVENRMRVIQNL
jgi:glycosyltransferase involved in cell wall biosynthesis